MHDRKLIAVCGGIGIGKTTLVNSLRKEMQRRGLNVKSYDEAVYSKLLDQFLSDQHKYAYSFQLFMLTRRQLTYEVARLDDAISIIDRSLADDYVFALLQHRNGNISRSEFECYKQIYDSFKPNFPDVVIVLNATVDTALARIRQRGRNLEDTYTREYITNLHNTYDEVIAEQYPYGSNVKVISLDYNADLDVTDGVINDDIVQDIIAQIFDD